MMSESSIPAPALALSSPSPAVAEPEIEIETDRPTLPTPDDGDTGGAGANHRVLLYNDDHHDLDEVVAQVAKATGCSASRAEAITMEAHFKGRAICFRGERPRCQDVCRVLREIRLQCEVDCD